MKKKKVAIIGGGSSGLFLANLLSEELDVFIFEKNNRLGKKILASGNGKCNFTNAGSYENKYNNTFANKIISKYDYDKTIEFFSSKGLIFKNDSQGRCYPVSECASSVLDCLKKDLSCVHIFLDSPILQIEKNGLKYLVKGENFCLEFDFVVCCSGSSASNLGSEKAYSYLKNLNIKTKELSASLAPVKIREKVSNLKGVRVKCLAKLVDKYDNVIYEEDGEILFKEDALSGIAIFNISSYINREKNKYKIVLDLSCGLSKEKLYKYIYSRKKEYPNIFKGFLNDKVAEYILNLIKLNGDTITEKEIELLVENICGLKFDVTGVYSLKDGQVCSGGISLTEISEELEFFNYPNMYAMGELLDVDGVSGGYNLQFAWSSAGVVAESINKKLKEKN